MSCVETEDLLEAEAFERPDKDATAGRGVKKKNKSRHEGVKDSRDEAIRSVVKGREMSMNDSTRKSRHEGVKDSRDKAIRSVVKGKERTMDLLDMRNRRDVTAMKDQRPMNDGGKIVEIDSFNESDFEYIDNASIADEYSFDISEIELSTKNFCTENTYECNEEYVDRSEDMYFHEKEFEEEIACMSYHENDFDYEDMIENERCDGDQSDEYAAAAEEKNIESEVLEPINHHERSSDSADTDSEHQISSSPKKKKKKDKAATDTDGSSTNDSEEELERTEWRSFWREFRKLTMKNAERAKAEKEAKEKKEKQAARAATKAEKAQKSAMQQGWTASAMELERPSRLVEANAVIEESGMTRTDWRGGRRQIPEVKSIPLNKMTLELIGRSGAHRKANIINTIKAALGDNKELSNRRKTKPLRQRGPPRYTYNSVINEGGETTKATERRRYIVIDSASEVNLVRDDKILDMQNRRDASGDGMSVRGFTSKTATLLTIAAPIIHPFEEMTAYYNKDFPENIMAMETLESLFEVSIVRSNDLKYLSCINNTTGETIRCFRDPKARNFYTYAWEDTPEATCFKISSTLTKAQGMGLSKVAAVRALEVEAIHKALSHVSCEALRKTFRENVFLDCDLTTTDVDNFEKYVGCTGCEIGKKTREDAVVTDPQKPSETIGAKVHADVFNISSEDKNFVTANFLMTVDDYSGYCNIIPLSNSTSAEIVRGLKIVAEIYEKAGHPIKRIRADNGGGFTADATKIALNAMYIENACQQDIWSGRDDTDIARELLALAIEIEYCTAQSHVRVAERAIRHAKELFRATIFDLPYLLPNKLYANAMVYVASSINITINSKNDVRCPWQLMHGAAPRSHDFLRASFGQLVTTYNQFNPNRMRDDSPRADVGIIVGRDALRKGSYYVYDIHDESIVSRHDVVAIGWNQTLLNNFHKINKQSGGKSGASVRITYGNGKMSSLIDLQQKRRQIEEEARLKEIDSAEDARAHNVRLANFTTHAYATESNADSDYREEAANILSSYNISIKECIKTVGIEATEEAALKEINALLKMKVFRFLKNEEVRDLVKARVNIITSQMLMKQKYDADNNFEKNKGRLIAHGNQQIFDEVFSSRAESPTININIAFAGLAIAAKAGPKTEIEVIDIDNAYLNADLNTPEYMYIGSDVSEILCKHHPEYRHFLLPDGRLAVELLKALYGLRTAGRDWYNLIAEVLRNGGYTRSEIDKCLFIHSDKTQIFLYVDDLLVIGAAASIKDLKTLLISKFGSIKVKNGQKISYLGMAIERQTDGSLHVHQRGYIENMAKEYNCEYLSSKYPATTNILHHADGHEDMAPVDSSEYLSLAMKLMFVAVRCRPDALFATTILAARCKKPTVEDYNRLLKIVRYLHGSKNQSLIFRSDTPFNPRMFIDASFQTHRDAKGHSGFVLFLDEGSAGIMFKSKKQQCVSDSSAEAELISLHEGVRQLMWMTRVLEELGVETKYPIEVYQDNKSTIQMASNETINFRGRSKFIDRKYFSVYQHVESGEINLVYVGTEAMVADFFTKAIVGHKFDNLRFSIMGAPRV